MPENAIIPDAEAAPETAKEKFERERLSRRQALKRLGMTSAMATFALFSVDDLARMVGKAMQQRAGDNKVAAQLAEEFQKIGVAFATPPGQPPLPGNCDPTQLPIKRTLVAMVTQWGTGVVDTAINSIVRTAATVFMVKTAGVQATTRAARPGMVLSATQSASKPILPNNKQRSSARLLVSRCLWGCD